MIEVAFKPSFIDIFNALEPRLQDEVLEKIELFKEPSNHRQLRVHKLHGELSGFFSFSVNYHYRIIFAYEGKGKNKAVFIRLGDHSLYD